MKNLILLAIIVVAITSCKMEPESDTEFVVKNSSSYKVELTIYGGELPRKVGPQEIIISLASNSEASYIYYLDGENRFFSSTFGHPADSAYIIFNNQKQLIFIRDTVHPRNIINIESWEGEKLSNTHYKYTYTITEEDYEMAEEIK